ncbi:acyl-CoA thioesterase [Diatrype stigma]|uniref:Acyl-CoA thioesterase n=1 Tax=Diatrype stigma TaxID=117547 RepID=A0AAN9UVL4_9PEZI
MYSAFLRPARRDGEIAYHVDCTAYGRTYATRTVRATQGAHDDTSCIYVGILSFQRCDLPPGNHLKYSIPMPHIGDSIRPESIPRARAQQRAMMAISARGDGTSPPLDGGDGDTAFDWRPLEGPPPPPPADEDERAQSRQQRAFVRSAPLSSDSASAHLAALACLSDTYALGAALGHGANPATLGPKIREEVAMGVSLNHNVSLHDPTARADEWLLCERDASWGADGRVLVHQRFWSAGTGRLVVSGMQEGLIRLKPGSSL